MARGGAAARVQPLPAPDRHAVQPDLHRRTRSPRTPTSRARSSSSSSTRLDPWLDGQGDTDRLVDQLEAALDAVTSLDEDRILRSLLHLVLATLRTNWFQAAPGDPPPTRVVFKLDPTRIPDLPLPRPMFEIFVYSPRVEALHLRAGRVARGGIRWSDRREDFRTEILGLMKAQRVKNVVIVPSGAKGGFVVKRPPADRDALAAEVEACYRVFIGGLLDVTDNLRGRQRSCRRRASCATTATTRTSSSRPTRAPPRSPTSPTRSRSARGFWLGDAFASGGSTGYDHKEMGITARGAWESVTPPLPRARRRLQNDDFTVVGIGDMSGDVFGNGMLLSQHIRLVAAFDHRHVFLDPDPDPAVSFAERKRLFELPRSSWDDYDRSADLARRRRVSRARRSRSRSRPRCAPASASPDDVAHLHARTS